MSTMTRRLIVISAIFASFLFASEARCETQTDREKAGLKGQVLTVVENRAESNETTVTAYNSRGGEAEQIIYSPIKYFRRAHTYDTQGRRITTDHYWHAEDSAPRQTTSYTYDAKGKLMQEVTCDTAGCFDKKVYIYDSRQKLTEEVLYYPSGDSFRVRLIHAYDPQERRIQTTCQEAHGSGLGIGDTVQEYDANGNVFRSTTHYLGFKAGDPRVDRVTTPPFETVSLFRYDSNGNVIETITHDSDRTPKDEDECRNPPCRITYVYENDFKGNWTTQKEFSCPHAGGGRKLEREARRTITYYEADAR